jgi:hypothetical protein
MVGSESNKTLAKARPGVDGALKRDQHVVQRLPAQIRFGALFVGLTARFVAKRQPSIAPGTKPFATKRRGRTNKPRLGRICPPDALKHRVSRTRCGVAWPSTISEPDIGNGVAQAHVDPNLLRQFSVFSTQLHGLSVAKMAIRRLSLSFDAG